MTERNTYWANQIKAFKQFQREIEGSTSSTAHTTYWLAGWDMGVKENQKKIADLEDDLNASIDEVKDKDKRIAELEAQNRRLRDEITTLSCMGSIEEMMHYFSQQESKSEGGADE